MDTALLGLILDTSVLVAAERRGTPVEQILEEVRRRAGELEVAVSVLTLAELLHGFHRATNEGARRRRKAFLDDVRSTLPIHPITAATSEIIGRIGAEQAARGIQIPLGDLLIGASALEQRYGVGTANLRHFKLIPDLVVVPL